ncbi:hypothetical protein L1987_52435 [Smallanthus sonchifolius]|uniref:Uncharacterized protein n=1 Tax=Smallanthus sonchifolius TaxID=185202 RepID=A0ACB9EUA9_9ASTR|nr:hypothetical protein L1987_52435 [Smallanthus sonchifolius]
MFAFSLPFFFVLVFTTTTTTAQPYKPTDIFFLNCGSSTPSSSSSEPRWDGDEHSNFVPSNTLTSSFSSTPDCLDASVPKIPYSTARIFKTSSFTYTFPVSQGPKFLRLHFYPATYSDLDTQQSFFSVSSNGYTLLTNFSAFLTLSFLRSRTKATDARVVKEFLIYVKDTQILNVTFTPSHNSYAFINGIEIVSMPENLYFNANTPKYVDMQTSPHIDSETALENIYRLNMGGGSISANNDTGMYRSWDQDNNYLHGNITGLRPVTNNSIMYTTGTPNYTAPEPVYQTQRSMGKQSDKYYLSWILPVDSGFYYILRLHFCNIIPQYTKAGQVIFMIFFNRQTAEQEVDLSYWTQHSGYPVFKDYIVFVNDPDGSRMLCARPVRIHGLPNEEVSLAHWGKFCYEKGTLHNIIDPELRGVIAPECLRRFGEVAVSCLKEQRSERPAMDEVVWGLEFAMELQEAAEKTVGGVVSENQEPLLPMQGEATNITDDDVVTGSTPTRNGTSSISSSYEGFKSETVSSEIQKPAGR